MARIGHLRSVIKFSIIFLDTGRYKLAERDLKRALELDPHFTDAQLNLDQVTADLERGHKFNVADTFSEDKCT